jgi:hypothetical protein
MEIFFPKCRFTFNGLLGPISQKIILFISTAVTAQFAATCSRRFLARRFFYREDGGDTILRNFGLHRFYKAPQKTAFSIKYSEIFE